MSDPVRYFEIERRADLEAKTGKPVLGIPGSPVVAAAHTNSTRAPDMGHHRHARGHLTQVRDVREARRVLAAHARAYDVKPTGILEERRPMRVLVACEYSGAVRDAFRRRGISAISADLLPTEAPGPHHQGDVRPLLRKRWDMVIAHPPCTRLCNSGVRWLHERNLWSDLDKAAAFFRACLNANASLVAVENPIMHGYAVERIGERHAFTCQPYDFGDPYTKRTCFWTRGLPPLLPTHSRPQTVRHDIHRMPPGPDRAKMRSKTFPGMAEAMAMQWGSLLLPAPTLARSTRP